MTTYNLTELRFGRNIKGTPMDLDRWEQFRSDAVEALQTFGESVEADEFWVEVHHGIGTFEGVVESSAVATLYWSEHGLHDGEEAWVADALAELVEAANALADTYEQDLVAVINAGPAVNA